jgi:hypothetical protein
VHHTAISPRAIAAETFESECTPAEACDTTGVRLYQVLEARRGEVFERWRAQMSGTLVPSSMPVVELLDHLPHVLDGIIEALRDPRVDTGPLESSPGPEGAAAIHGAQRLRLGFSLDAVVREYGVLREAITRTALESGATIQLREHEIVANAIVAGIAEAVSEYARQRDAELARQANEHFAFIAHELRNPLATATNAFAVMKARNEAPAHSRAAAAVERGLARATELIDETLHVARAASGISLRLETTTLSELLAEAELAIHADAELKNMRVTVAVERDERVQVDARLVRSALVNLASNAVKYSGEGGHVDLRARSQDDRVVIEVDDSCGGLSPEDVQAMFAPFVRLDHKKAAGFGLGLAIARAAAEAHGGIIRVENLPGRGCRFALELPHADRANG